MKQNHLFIRLFFQLVVVAIMITFLQSCFCKDCVMAVSKDTVEESPLEKYALNDQNNSDATSEAVSKQTILASPESYGAQTIAESHLNLVTNPTLMVQPSSHIVSMLVVTNEAETFKISEMSTEQNFIRNVIKTTKLNLARSCPFGIRSINSHIVAGPNMSFKSSKEGDDIYGNNPHKHQPGLGFQLGMSSNLSFTDKFSLNPSILLKQNNASEKIKYTYTEPGSVRSSESKDKYSYTFLSAPVLASYKVANQLDLFAGPEVNYLLNARVKRDGQSGGDSKENLTKNSVKLGIGVQAGAKYTIPSANGNSPFAIQLLYEHRISRLNKKNSDGYNSYNAPAWNLKGFQLGVTCSICNLKKGTN